jgi:hypothetical protein
MAVNLLTSCALGVPLAKSASQGTIAVSRNAPRAVSIATRPVSHLGKLK